jgi:hypothetical protein
MAIQRLQYDNKVQGAAAVITPSDELSSSPFGNLRDQLLSKKGRTKTGWTFGPQGFDAIPFDDSADGKRICYLPATTYATGAAAAAGIQTALNASGYHTKAVASITGDWRPDRVTIDGNGNASTLFEGTGLASRDFSQSTPAQCPQFTTNALGTGRPAMYFDGTNRSMVCAANLSTLLGANGVGTIMVVFALDSDASANDALVWAASGADVVDLMWVGGAGKDFRARGTDAGGVKSATKTASTGVGAIGIAIWRYDGTNLVAGAFNSLAANFSAGTVTAAIKASVLGTPLHIGSDGTNHPKGYIFRVIAANTALGNTDRLAMMLLQYYAGLVEGAPAPSWADTLACTYDSTTKKFTISRSGGAGTQTFPVATQGVGNWVNTEDFNERAFKDIGFTTDRTTVTSAVGDIAVSQSRHWMKVDLGSALAIQQGIVFNGNFGSATMTLQWGNQDQDLWGNPAGSQALTVGTAYGWSLAYVPNNFSQTKRWFRLVIDDVGNTNGYSEFAKLFLGPYAAPSLTYTVAFKRDLEELTGLGYAEFGANLPDSRTQRWVWTPQWEEVPEADRAIIETLATTAVLGGNFFIQWDPLNNPGDISYVFRRKAVSFQLATAQPLWNQGMELAEVIG